MATEGDVQFVRDVDLTVVSEVDTAWHTSNWSILNETISGRSIDFRDWLTEDWRIRRFDVEPNLFSRSRKEDHVLSYGAALSFPSYINEPSIEDFPHCLEDQLSEPGNSRPGTAPGENQIPLKPFNRYQYIKDALKRRPKKIETSTALADDTSSNNAGGNQLSHRLFRALATNN